MKPIPLFALLPAALFVAPVAFSAPPAAPQATVNELNTQYQRAIVLAKSGDLDGAVALCRKIIAKAPKAAPVWATLARMLVQQKNFPEAINAGKKAVALAPKTASFHADLADYYLLHNDPKQAENWANSALKLDPKNDMALSVLTTERLVAKKYKEAIPLLSRLQAVRGGKDRAVAQNQVSIYMRLGDKAGAMKAAQAFAQKAPKDAEAALAVVDLAMETGNTPIANAYVVKLAKLAPNSPLPSYYQGRVTLSDKATPLDQRFIKAEKSFQKAVDLAPTEPTFRAQLAFTQLGQGNKMEEARTNLTAALLYDNHNVPARRGMALLEEQEEKWDASAEQYDAYLTLAPSDSEQRRRYAGVLLKANRKPEAYKQFDELATRNPEDTHYLKEWASFLVVDKQYADARGVYARILARDDSDAEAHLGIAKCFQEEHRLRDARDAYERVITANPKNEDAYLLLAQLYVNDNDPKETTDTLERGLKAIPDANRIRWALIEQYINAKRDEDARREIAKLTLKGSGDARNQYRLIGGNLYMAREQYPQAIVEFERIGVEEPDNPEVLLALATAYQKGGRATDAATTYDRAAQAAEKLLSMPEHSNNKNLRAVLVKVREVQKKPELATEFLKNLDGPEKTGEK